MLGLQSSRPALRIASAIAARRWPCCMICSSPPLPPAGEGWGEGKLAMTSKIALARTLRRASTDAEGKLWRYLRNRLLGGYRFRRQTPLGKYIVDFVCMDARLVVELDGAQHLE